PSIDPLPLVCPAQERVICCQMVPRRPVRTSRSSTRYIPDLIPVTDVRGCKCMCRNYQLLISCCYSFYIITFLQFLGHGVKPQFYYSLPVAPFPGQNLVRCRHPLGNAAHFVYSKTNGS